MQTQLNATEVGRLLLELALNRKAPTEEQLEKVLPAEERKTIIAVCASPKSGSTYLTNLLSVLSQKRAHSLTYAYASNEHELYLPAMIAGALTGAVSQLHLRATPHNVQLFKLFHIRPVVLTRNIFDSIESLARDLRKKQSYKKIGTGLVGYSFLWVDSNIKELSDSELYDMVIDLAVPWYINFYVSWYRAGQMEVISPIFCTYEEMMKNKRKTLSSVLDSLGINQVELEDSLLNKNVIPPSSPIGRGSGESGLGLQKLNQAQIQKVHHMCGYYKNIDFTTIGIT